MLHQRFQKLSDQQIFRRQQLAELVQFVAEVASLACKRSDSNRRAQRSNELRIHDPLLRQPDTGIHHLVDATEQMYRSFPWGPVFLWRLITWSRCLIWPRDAVGNLHYNDISYIELYLDYALATHTRSPRNVARKLPGHWILDDIEIRPDANDSPTLAQQTLTWTKAIKWLHKCIPNFLWPAQDIDRAYSLGPLGCSSWLRGITPRPKLHNRLVPTVRLHEFFTASERASRAMNRPIDLPFRPNHDHPDWLLISHEAKVVFEQRLQNL